MKPITLTLKLIDGTTETRHSMAGAEVEAILNCGEYEQVVAKKLKLRELDGAFVPLDMKLVDGLALELVTPETGEGSKAPPMMFCGSYCPDPNCAIRRERGSAALHTREQLFECVSKIKIPDGEEVEIMPGVFVSNPPVLGVKSDSTTPEITSKKPEFHYLGTAWIMIILVGCLVGIVVGLLKIYS